MNQILSVVRKEFKAYFGSPMAAIFIGAFLLSALFSFFWVETFFARNIADIRPLFRWMPALLIFLVAALTMRQWSEEQKMGTMEVLLTLPVRISSLVIGKFLAVLALVGISLLLTSGLPLTVATLGNIDWGPVFGGYLGAMLMASSYIAIGLYVSSRTDNQIIALIVSVLLCGLFYLVGSSGITNFMGNQAGEFFRALGTGSRFASIERGVVDLRDLLYYTSLTVFFLVLNVGALDRKGWSTGDNARSYRRNVVLGTWLLAANLLAVNVWLYPVHVMRLDLTEQQEYSISDTTRDLVVNLPDPLIMRGYFSAKTHPLLAPLVPRIKDLMDEYRIASEGRVEVAFVDPRDNEEVEREANQQYGIKPVPFQVAGRYEAGVVNSYFNVLIQYGDQHVILGFNDLIEVKSRPGGQLDVGLRNLEYDLTKSIKKVVYGFQSLDGLFENSTADLRLVFINSSASMPENLVKLSKEVREVSVELANGSGGKLRFEEIDPDDGRVNSQEIMASYHIEPLAASLFSEQTFFLHLLLVTDDRAERVFLGSEMGKGEIQQEISAALKRNASGFLKTVGIWLPTPESSPMAMYQPQGTDDQYRLFQEVIRENYNLQKVDLSEGRIGGNVDALLLVGPQEMSNVDWLAVDQYLMRGGAVVALTGSYQLDLVPGSRGLNVRKVEQGISGLLSHYGIELDSSLVLDRQNEPFPVPVTRNLGGFAVQEIRQLDYPFFVDVRSDGMDQQDPVTASLPAVTMNWVSPLLINTEKNSERKVVTLLRSSPDSWLQESVNVQPDFQLYPQLGFPEGDEFDSRVLAVSVQGAFESYFAGREDPRLAKEYEETVGKADDDDPDKTEQGRLPPEPLIRKSVDSARLVVVGSSEFINDTVLGISQSVGQDRFLNSLEFLQNLVDWSVADEDLLAIRSRGSHARLLNPMSGKAQVFWEWLNYGVALLLLLGVCLFGAARVRKEEPMELV